VRAPPAFERSRAQLRERWSHQASIAGGYRARVRVVPPRERSPVDVLHAVIAAGLLVVLLVAEALFGSVLVDYVHDTIAGASATPKWLVTLLVLSVRVAAIVAVVAGLVAVVVRRQWRLGLSIVAAGVLASVLQSIANTFYGESAPPVVATPGGIHLVANSSFPSADGLASVAGAVTAAAPWLPRRWRRVAWALVVGTAVARLVTAPVSFDTPTALVVGWLAGSLVLMVAGGPVRRPPVDAVEAGLGGVGLAVGHLTPAGVDARGSTPYFGRTPADTRVFVKVLSADERSADLLFRAYRRLVPHDLGDERQFSSLRRAVEHEALVALAASQLGTRTPRLAGFAEVAPGAFALAYEAVDGHSLDEVDPERLDDATIAAIWEQVACLRRHRIAHRDLRLANLFLDDRDQVWMIDFGFSELAASDLLLRTDLAELLASSTTAIGVDRAVDAGVVAVGAPAIADAADRLRPYALSGATRTAMKAQPGLLEALARRAREATAPRA
jgi:undecaprenyl-diphosphatase